MDATLGMIHLDVPSSNSKEEENTLLDFISDRSLSRNSLIARITRNKKIEEALSSLSNREEEILRMRFGIGYNHSCTLDEVGSHYKLTKERIRQIEKRALRQVKEREVGKLLRDFIE